MTPAEIALTDGECAVEVPLVEHPAKPRARFNAQFLGSTLERYFKLRLELEFVRELAHLPLHLLPLLRVLRSLELFALPLERVPHLDHALGLQVRISLDLRLVLDAGEEPLGALRPLDLVHGAVYTGLRSARGWNRVLGLYSAAQIAISQRWL